MGETRFPGVRGNGYKAADSRINNTSVMDQHSSEDDQVYISTELFK